MAEKKKTKKNVPSGIAHINSTFNNTIITITDSVVIQFLGVHPVTRVLKVLENQHLLLHN